MKYTTVTKSVACIFQGGESIVGRDGGGGGTDIMWIMWAISTAEQIIFSAASSIWL